MRPLLIALTASALTGLAATPALSAPQTVEDCYADVSSAAEILQVCLVNQTYENECLPDEQTLAAQTKQCRDIGGNADRIDLARQVGASLVEGDPTQSVWQQQYARQVEKKRLLRVNEDRFRNRYVNLLEYSPTTLEQAFDTRSCPLAFEGTGQNYLMSGLVVIKRQGEQVMPQLNMAEEEQTHLYFARMTRGRCYRAGGSAFTPNLRVEPDQSYYIYNFTTALIGQIPASVKPTTIEEIRSGDANGKSWKIGKPLTVKVRHYASSLQGKVATHLCDSPVACLRERAKIIDDYQAYNTALRQRNQANACLVYLDPNRTGEISIDQLYGMDCTEANGRKLLASATARMNDIAQRLFR